MSTTTEQFKTAECPHCKIEHHFEVCNQLPRIIPLCDSCAEIQVATWHDRQKREELERRFRAGVPSRYCDAITERIKPGYTAALSWKASDHHGGLGLIGPTGEGKTCAVACLIRKLEKPFLWWSGTQARDAATLAGNAEVDREGARRRWEHSMKVEVLVIDDVSQAKMLETFSSSLFNLLETRLGNGLPTIWTSQLSLPELRAKIVRQNGGDAAQADAISRRLGQHSLVLVR
ncbi:MAG: ATP-binding protein [Akkermansiaceae bacterium]|nr:ATP-binding protein [Akkermansiaceae bacterium]